MQQTEDHSAAPAAPGHEPGAADANAAAGAHESAGLPQFDITWWPGQILWFLIVFFGIMAFMRWFVVPRLGGTIEHREGHIAGQIVEARRLKEAADAEVAQAAAEMAQSRSAAQKVAAEARAKTQAEAAAALAVKEAELAATGAEAEARIAAARDAAMRNVASIAADTANAIVQKLTGKAATAAELASARG